MDLVGGEKGRVAEVEDGLEARLTLEREAWTVMGRS